MAEAQRHHHTGHRQRLKAEFLARGLEGWPDHKVLELLLCYAIPQGDVNGLAHELMERFGSLAGVLDASVEELKKVPGVGEHTAVLLRMLPALPSQADWLVTDVLRAALAPIGIHLEDHLIFVDGDMLSLKSSEHRRNLSAV